MRKWVWIWDFLVGTLVVFPVLTGGIWIRRPGFFLELSQLAVPVLVVALIAGLMRLSGVDLSQSFFVRWFLRLWRYWNEILTTAPLRTLVFSWILVATIYAWAALRRHWGFGTHAEDLGIFGNTIWNLVHGFGYVSAPKGGMNLLADHQSAVFFLFAPIFKIFPYPETLLICQSFGIASGGIALFYLGKQIQVLNWVAALLPWMYWLYRPLRNTNLFDFHPEVFMLPLFLWATLGLQSKELKNKILGMFLFVIALGAKESAAPVAVGIGLAWILGSRKLEGGSGVQKAYFRTLGGFAILLGLCVLWLDLKWVPQFFGRQYSYISSFAALGSSFTEVVLSPVLRPLDFLSTISQWERIRFYLFTLAGLAFIPMLNLAGMVASLPGYALVAMGSLQLSNLMFHYTTEPAVGLFIALPWALKTLTEHTHWFQKLKSREVWLGVWILFWMGITFERSEFFQVRFYRQSEHQKWLASEFLPKVKPEVSVIASGGLVPHLLQRHWVHYLFDSFETNKGEKIQCLIWDSNINSHPYAPSQWQEIKSKAHGEGYKIAFQCKGVEVLEIKNGSCLETIQCLDESEPSVTNSL